MRRFKGSHWWRAAMLAALVPFALGACGDDDEPTGPEGPDVEGTWSFTEDGRPSYVRITEDAIQIYDNTGACFFSGEVTIESRDGEVFTVDNGIDVVEWTIEEVGSNLVVRDDEGVSTTLTPSTVNTSTLPVCASYDPEIHDFAFPPCDLLPQLNVPGSVDGTIEPGDARFYDESWLDVYRIELTEDTDVSITMTADNQDDLNAYLSIYDAEGVEIIDNDAYGEGDDARVEVALGPGCYMVAAGSYSGDDPGETGGGYTLTANDEFSFVFPPAPCAELPEITVGGAIDSELAAGDLRWSDGTWYEAYSLQLDTEQTVTITETAEDTDLLDPYLFLFDGAAVDESIVEADDIDYDGGNYNAQIADITLAPGCYIVVAGSWMGDASEDVGGAYTLSVD